MKENQAENKEQINNGENEDLLIESTVEETDGEGEGIKIGDFIDEDERFKKANNEKVIDKRFKKKIKKENQRSFLLNKKKNILSGIKKIFNTNNIFRTLDFLLNVFSISAIVLSVVFTINYLIVGNPYMVVAGCLLIFVNIYLNEKIN